MPRGRPKGTTHPKGIANAVWQCVIIKCDNGRHPVNRASGLVAKDIAKLFPEWKLSAERVRHLYMEVEKRRTCDPKFAALSSKMLSTTQNELTHLNESGQYVVVPAPMKGMKETGESYGLMVVRKHKRYPLK
jgi:hypothetical protein